MAVIVLPNIQFKRFTEGDFKKICVLNRDVNESDLYKEQNKHHKHSKKPTKPVVKRLH